MIEPTLYTQTIAAEIVLHRSTRRLLVHRDRIDPDLVEASERLIAEIEGRLITEGVDLATIDTDAVTTMVRNLLGADVYEALTGDPRR